MEGYGFNNNIPDSIVNALDDIWIFHGNPTGDNNKKGGLGKWTKLKPGHGIGFSSDGLNNKLSDRFGVELSFSVKMKKLYPNYKIAIIKYARSGSSIDSLMARNFGCWEPDYKGKTGINQYDYFLKTIRTALQHKDIDGDGKIDNLIPSGVLWMQGESDAMKEITAKNYYSNLKRLMDLMRAVFRDNNLPIAIGKISDSGNNTDGKIWTYGKLVQQAQEEFVDRDNKALIIRNTKNYSYSDLYHYDSEGYVDLGYRFADAIFKLSK